MFVKEMAEKKATERAEVIKQARKLLLQKRPLCRRINRGLFASEVLSPETNIHIIPKHVISYINQTQNSALSGNSSVFQRTGGPSGVAEYY